MEVGYHLNYAVQIHRRELCLNCKNQQTGKLFIFGENMTIEITQCEIMYIVEILHSMFAWNYTDGQSH